MLVAYDYVFHRESVVLNFRNACAARAFEIPKTDDVVHVGERVHFSPEDGEVNDAGVVPQEFSHRKISERSNRSTSARHLGSVQK